jgi:tRNA A37 threonylcarbamoyladenosine dehydratase
VPEDPKIVFEPVMTASPAERGLSARRDIPGSTAFVPSVAGLIIAGEVIKDLAGYGKNERNND